MGEGHSGKWRLNKGRKGTWGKQITFKKDKSALQRVEQI